MCNVQPHISDELIEKAKHLNTTLLTDVMGCTGSLDYDIQPVGQGMRVIGTAITVKMRPGDNLFLHQAIYSGGKGYVLVADGKGHKENAYLGELMANASKAVGVEGIVIDGLVRDKEELQQLKYPIFAKGFTPNGPAKEGPGEINTPISCGGVAVNPGDFIMGDDDGVIVVPREKLSNVITLAEEKLSYENDRLKKINDYISAQKQNPNQNSEIIEPSWLREKMKRYGL